MINSEIKQENNDNQIEAPGHRSYSEVHQPQNIGTDQQDIVSQFRANLNQLEDLQGRMKFLLNEVSGTLTKKIHQ